jgi:hypothetical protein
MTEDHKKLYQLLKKGAPKFFFMTIGRKIHKMNGELASLRNDYRHAEPEERKLIKEQAHIILSDIKYLKEL